MEAICFLETKTSNERKLRNMVEKLGFRHAFAVDQLEFLGGLLIWKHESIGLEVMRHSSQAIHYVVKGQGGSSYMLSFAYVYLNRLAKDNFWSECKEYYEFSVGLWILMGDFNDIASGAKNWGSAELNTRVLIDLWKPLIVVFFF